MSTPADLESIKTQIEYYFLPASISRDQFLISQMNSSRYVDVSVIAAFPKLLAMTSDIEVIKAAIKLSDTVELDSTNTKVRGKAFARTSLLLRDVAPETTVESLTNFVSGIIAKENIVKVRPDISNVWYIDFANETACVDAFNNLLGKKFNNNDIRCTIKTMPVLVNNSGPADKTARTAANAANANNTNKTSNIRYLREQMAKIVEKMSKYTYDAPDSYIAYKSANNDNVPILREAASKVCSLLEPIPIMYPASPSPDMAMSAPSTIPPFFDLSQPLGAVASTGGVSTSLGGLSDLSSLGTAMNFTSSFITSNNTNSNTQQKKRSPQGNNGNNSNNNNQRTRNTQNNRSHNNNGIKSNHNGNNTQKKMNNNNNHSSNNNNNNAHKKKVHNGPLALGIKSTAAPVSTMNFASVVATQPTEEAVLRAQEAALRNLAMRQVNVKKDEDNQQTPTSVNASSSPVAEDSKDANKQKKKKVTKTKKDKATDAQATTPAPASNRWSDLLKTNNN